MYSRQITSILLEEAMQFTRPEQVQKFARRAIKKVNTITPGELVRDGIGGVVVAPVLGAAAGMGLDHTLNDNSDALTLGLAGLGGAAIGFDAGTGLLTRKYDFRNTSRNQRVIDRLKQRGYEVNNTDRNIMNNASATVRATNLDNYFNNYGK